MAVPSVERKERVVTRRRPWRAVRWLVLLLMPVAVVVLLVLLGVQLVLTSDIPRSRIVHELQMETGLRFEAASSRTRWPGMTELRDISIALPLEDEPFLRIPVLQIRHTPLLWIAAGFEVHEATIDDPLLRLRQDEYGRWNVLRAVEIVQAVQEHRTGTGEVPPFPRVSLRNGIINLLGPEGQVIEAPLEFEGEPETPLSWAFRLSLGEALLAGGRVAPRGEWQHQVELLFGRDQTLLQAFVPEEVLPLEGAAKWQGGLENGQFAGRLHLERLHAGEYAAKGDATLGAVDGRLVLRPRNVVLGRHDQPEMQARVHSGVIMLDGPNAELQRVRIEGAGAVIDLNGQWDLEREAGEIVAIWTGAAIGPVLGHEGEMRIKAMLPEVGASTINADVRSIGSTAQGTWESQLRFSIRGASWSQMVGEMTAQQLQWRDDQGVLDFSGAMARVEAQWPEIQLNRIVIPGAERSRIDAHLNAEALTWRIEAEAAQWDIPRLRGGALDLLVRAEGDALRVRVPELRAAGPNFSARFSGNYDLASDLPLHAAGRIAYRMPDDARGRPDAGEAIADIGAWLAQAEVSGQLQPLNLRMAGELLGRDVRIGEAPVEQVSIPFTARANANAADFASSSFHLLGGEWRVEGRYRDLDRTIALELTGDAIPLQSAMQVVDLPMEMPGTAAGRLQVSVPNLDLDALTIQGEFNVADIHRPGLAIETGRGRLETSRGVLTLRDLEMTAGDAMLRGLIQFDLRAREEVHLDLDMQRWPVAYNEIPVTAVVDGRASVDVRLADLAFRGRVDAAADVAHTGNAIGRINTVSMLDGRRINVQSIRGDFCRGTIEGSGVIVLDDWLQSGGDLRMAAVDLEELQRCFEIDDEISGFAGMHLRIGRSTDARALGPMQVAIDIDSTDATFRTISVGDAEIRAYFGPERFVLDRSTFNLADGVLTLWSRLSPHGQERFVHVQATIERIDIDQLFRAFKPDGGDLPGRVNGQLSFGGYTEPPHRLFGEGRLGIFESDLANLPGISAVYNLLNLRIGPQAPSGRGDVRIRLEGSALEIYRLRYFNRGADLAASLRIEDVWAGAESPISGVAAGTLRPLREMNIPFLDLDRMLGALQTGAATVEISGTLEDREIRPVPFADVAGRFVRILGGGGD